MFYNANNMKIILVIIIYLERYTIYSNLIITFLTEQEYLFSNMVGHKNKYTFHLNSIKQTF